MGYENGVINRIKTAYRSRRRRHKNGGKTTGCASFFSFFFFVDWKLQYSRQFTIAEVHIITYWCRVLIFLRSTVPFLASSPSARSSRQLWRREPPELFDADLNETYPHKWFLHPRISMVYFIFSAGSWKPNELAFTFGFQLDFLIGFYTAASNYFLNGKTSGF